MTPQNIIGWKSKTIAEHGESEIHKQFHNMLKYTNSCTIRWNTHTIGKYFDNKYFEAGKQDFSFNWTQDNSHTHFAL